MPDAAEIRLRIKLIIIDRLMMDKFTVETIGDDDLLFGDGLGLDSVDGLELVLGLEQEFDIKIKNKAIQRDFFKSVATLGDYVEGRLSGSIPFE